MKYLFPSHENKTTLICKVFFAYQRVFFFSRLQFAVFHIFFDGKNVVVHAEKDYETNLRKFGAILGDRAEVGCGSVLNPGTVIGKRTQIYPLTMARGVYPSDSIVKSTRKIVKKKI